MVVNLANVIAGLRPPAFFSKTVTSASNVSNHSAMWTSTGFPSNGIVQSGINGASYIGPTNGSLPWANPPSGNAYLARLQAQLITSSAPVTGKMILLVDWIWTQGSIDATGATSPQAIFSGGWPSSRDIAGTALGDGILLGAYVSAAMGAGTPTITVGYTNSSGVAGRTGSNVVATKGSDGAQSFFIIGLQAGDTGVRTVDSVALSSSWTSGTLNLVAFRPIALLECETPGRSSALDAVTGCLPQLFNGTALSFIVTGVSGLTGGVTGEVQYTWI